ncbi:MAG: hypothetical protein FWF10_05645 [Clostridiales bacterium]|nr:hypothetical protein [Clostridiales bacterium]
MTETTFSQSLRRGLGSAILELQKNQERARYRELVLRCCLRDISYDWQCEGTKGDYLYYAVWAIREPEYFLEPVIQKFHSRCNDKLFFQLARILYLYAGDGYAVARETLYTKYDYFAQKGEKLLQNFHVDEGMQWDELACTLWCFEGFAAFKRYANAVGEMCIKKPHRRTAYDLWYRHRAEDKFGKERIEKFYSSACGKSLAIAALVDSIEAEDSYYERERTEKIQPTVDMLLQAAKEAATDENPRLKMHSFLMECKYTIMNRASEQERIELAQAVLREEDKTVKALLLLQFWPNVFPIDIMPLLAYAQSEHELLAGAAMDTLREHKDKRLHELAMQLLENKGLESGALSLLYRNYRKSDDAVILRAMEKTKTISHDVQMDLRDIYTHHRSTAALPILLRAYQKGDCSFCRCGIVQAMQHCGVLTDDMLEECLYDSYDDTRKFARRVKRRRERAASGAE